MEESNEIKIEHAKLLFRDLCARLPYQVKLQYSRYPDEKDAVELYDVNTDTGELRFWKHKGPALSIGDTGYLLYRGKLMFKPYLYPISAIGELNLISPKELSMLTGYELYDFYNKNHIAYRTLDGKDMFELGLAVKASKEMYNN